MIAHGHRADALPDYTRRQIQLYYEQTIRIDARVQASMMQAIVGSFSKKAGQIIDKLLKVGHG